MKVVFADTFAKSLKRLIRRERWYYKAYDFVRYDFPRFCRNIIRFRKALWNFYNFDSHGSLIFLRTSIQEVHDGLIKYGNEVATSRNKKVKMMERAIEILDHHIEDDFIEMAEQKLGKKVSPFKIEKEIDENGKEVIGLGGTDEDRSNDSEIFKLALKMEKDTWKELFEILRGQDYNEFNRILKQLPDEEKRSDEHWNKWFDGSGLKGWWD